MWRAAVLAAALVAAPAGAREVCVHGDGAAACYSDAGGPTGYDHAILGDTPEWTLLRIGQKTLRFANGFFEDIAPRLADVDGNPGPEVIAVQTDFDQGARLIVLSLQGQLLAATPYIGQPHRWFAQAGVGDFDRDGRIEIAYVDRPHLAKELVFVRLEGGKLTEVARLTGLTNHRIGDNSIAGGRRNCGDQDEIVLANADWTRIMAVRIGAAPVDIGPYSKAAMVSALACQ